MAARLVAPSRFAAGTWHTPPLVRSVHCAQAVKFARSAPADRPTEDIRQLPTDRLIAHIQANHHETLRQTLPSIVQRTARVTAAHSARKPRLHEVHQVVEQLAQALAAHIDLEERTLFPVLTENGSDSVARKLQASRVERVMVGTLLDRMRTATDDFQPPSWAPEEYRRLYEELRHLHADTLRHLLAENHILTPRLIARASQDT